MRKIPFLCLIVILSASLFGCTAQKDMGSAPSFHNITTGNAYVAPQDIGGAAGYDHAIDNYESRYYAVNDYYNMESAGTLHILSHFETYQQTTEYSCGSSAALMVLHYFGVDTYSERELGEMLHIDESEGTSVDNMIKLFTELGWRTEYHADVAPMFETEESFIEFVVSRLDAGMPIMIDWLDWAGHWQVIIGVDTCDPDYTDDDVLIIADPYDVTDHYQDGYYTYPLTRFYYLWREGSCANKTVPYEQPFVAVKPD